MIGPECRCLKCGLLTVKAPWSWCARCRAECSDGELAAYILGFEEASRLAADGIAQRHLDEMTARDIQRVRARRLARGVAGK